ncbi:NAD(+) diphosphatase [Phycicoccus sp. CSK15P-2]|uniref:NAD(+) diphosphatase n=1 Tax=Phycicoccus sp. CSK15P-2 TaxID=2807627 RepID=UPI00195210B4|nr:NAD(+) diphosphatase [Phycicoccus sp. CSK15P-2]MBM6405208.1 NAD(+) diphosphatase [Phycicoccus sp. CSK15P-2]
MARADRSLLPQVALTATALDRRAELRGDDGLLPRLLADPATRVVRLRGDALAVEERDGDLRLALGPPEPDDASRFAVYLGEAGGVAHVGVVANAPGEEDASLRTLRQVGAHLDDVGAALFATTLALANWHRTHPFCPRCGTQTVPAQSGWVRRCPRDDSEHYPRTDVAVIMAVVDDADRLLLAQNSGFRRGGMSVLAGFVEPGETLAAAVAREVDEEVGVAVTEVRYRGDQPWPFPSSLMVGFTARATTTSITLRDGEIAAARWFGRDELVSAVADGSVVVPGRVSIARRLIELWFGGPLEAPEAALR